MSSQTLLIPINFPDPDPLPSTFVGGFTSCKIRLLGIYEISSGITEEEKQRREIEAYHTLYSFANQFVKGGDTAEVDLVMGEDIDMAPTEVAENNDLDAVLVPNPITSLSRVFVPVRDERFAEPIAKFVGTLNQEYLVHTTLFHVAETDDDAEQGEKLLEEVRAELTDAGFPGASIDTEVVVSDDPAFAISRGAKEYDIIIMGETEERASERVFGKTYDTIAEQTQHPVVIVREK